MAKKKRSARSRRPARRCASRSRRRAGATSGSRLRLPSRGRTARSGALPHVSRSQMYRRLPGEHRYPRIHPEDRRKGQRAAYDVITATNLLPAICGRVCPQESQCEGVCIVGETLEPVAIGRLERFVGDLAISEGWTNVPYIEPTRFRIGIVGSGPAGMACAADMAKAGCDVTVYEAKRPATERSDRRGGREAAAAWREVRMQYARRTPVHDRTDDRRDGLSRGVHRNGGRLHTASRHTRRFAERRALRERASRAAISCARASSPISTRPCRSASAWPPSARATHAMDALRVTLRLGAEKVNCIYRRTKAEPGACRRDPSRGRGRHRVSLAHRSRRDPRRRQGQRARDALHQDGARRA